ncbi:MAG: hypothetical protein LUG99_22905 [Lachnospiraceae bacterium]|nr:hypothetical protein [Lachnospiraceae bacterium]
MSIKDNLKNRISKIDKRQREEDTAMRGRFFNRAYHKNFEDYAEYMVQKPNGKGKIVRVYTGKYYSQQVSSSQYILVRLLFTLLTAAVITLFIFGCTRDLAYNYVRYVALFEALCIPFLFYQVILLIGYIFADRKMDIHSYRLYHEQFLTVTRYGSILHALTAGVMLLYLLLHQSFSAKLFMPIVLFLISAAFLLTINRVENAIEYARTDSDAVPPPGSIRISDASRRRR